MIKTGIIGHRGAAGLALENSQDSLLAALELNIDAIEFDVRRTRDSKLVVMHDATTGRTADEKIPIHSKTLQELKAIKLKNGQQIASLEDVFQLIGNKLELVIDIKDSGSTKELLRMLEKYPKARVSFTSLQYGELKKLHKARPDLPIFVRDLLNPFEVIHTARIMHARGISLNAWLMNPLTYLLAIRRKLEVRVYTVNSIWLARWLRLLYPEIVLYTDHPQRFVSRKKSPTAV